MSGVFWQDIIGIVRLSARCERCKGKFIVPVVRDMDREVVSDTKGMRISKPARQA